jgi:hypothetical protein
MPSSANGNRVRQLLLDAIRDASRKGAVSFSPEDVMRHVVATLNATSDEGLKRAVLCHFNELLRTGVVGLGDATAFVGYRAGPPWPNGAAHVTPQGEEMLKHASRDPINPSGYLAYVEQEAKLDTVTRGYVEEALNTFRACCYKATALLIGAAIESLVLELRDTVVSGLTKAGKPVSSDLNAWQVKKAVEAVAAQVLPDLKSEAKRSGDDALRKLHEEADSRLLPIAAEFRRLRNNAGHPASLDPVDATAVHANLLLFPSTAKLLRKLTDWVSGHYQ